MSKPKTVNGVEVIKSGKVVYCDYSDIPKLITQNHNQIIKLNKLNNAEDEFKNRIRREIAEEQKMAKIRTGSTLNRQIEKFGNSSPLITLRQEFKIKKQGK